MINNITYNNILVQFADIKTNMKIPSRTFMQVSGYPHFENVASNLLAFFFTIDEEHGLGDLFFKSLLEAILVGAAADTSNIIALREYPTLKNNRLDIVLKNGSYSVGIENKIFSGVNNDLQDYMKTIKDIAKQENTIPINILLSMKDEKSTATMNGYYHLTYDSFFEVVRRNLGEYVQNADNSWLNYLIDFMKTIDGLKRGGITMNSELLTLIAENKLEVESFIKECNDTKRKMGQLTKDLKVLIELDKYRNYMKISDFCHNPPNEITSSYVIDIEKPTGKILVVETYLDGLGWHIAIWDRYGGKGGKDVIEGILSGLNMSFHARDDKDPNGSMFVVVADYNYDTHLDILRDKVYEILDLEKKIII